MMDIQENFDRHKKLAQDIYQAVAEKEESVMASGFCQRINEMISDFDKTLDQEHEVGIRLVSFGQEIIFHAERIGYFNPSLITFSGLLDDGSPVELVQHVSQISFLLMAVKRLHPEKHKIGFKSDGE